MAKSKKMAPFASIKKGVARKSGGMVKGKAAASRPDKRARGGATAMTPASPMSPAGNMSKPGFESKQAPSKDEGGKGPTI